MDTSAIVLNKLLSEKSVDIWARLKMVYIDPAFSNLYSAIGKHYDLYGAIPSFEELKIVLREGAAKQTLAIVELADAEDIPADVALNALIDQYTQNETIKQLDKFIDKLPVYDTHEIKEKLSEIVLDLDEKTLNSETVYSMADLMIFRDASEALAERVYLGLNNAFDAAIGGCARQELILVGGKRGSGKSIVCSNSQVNEFEANMTSVYFTIEMRARETMERNIAILSGVDHHKVKLGQYNEEEALAIVRARASMFEDSESFVKEYLDHRNRLRFEQDLVRKCRLRQDAQMIIVDDRSLTLNSIDLHLGKIKAKFGDKFRVAQVDYLNQIVIEGADMYDWKPQIAVSKGLKNLARKHDILILSPYQIDATGEARFAKGILDAADIAITLNAHNKEDQIISFDTTKIRGDGDMKCTSGMNWKTLRISPIPVDPPKKEESEDGAKRKKTKKQEALTTNESPDDAPPWEA